MDQDQMANKSAGRRLLIQRILQESMRWVSKVGLEVQRKMSSVIEVEGGIYECGGN